MTSVPLTETELAQIQASVAEIPDEELRTGGLPRDSEGLGVEKGSLGSERPARRRERASEAHFRHLYPTSCGTIWGDNHKISWLHSEGSRSFRTGSKGVSCAR